ncbi:hypothetical protein JDV09_18695 [Mycobacterium sp. Y57]|uniref:hypothetical protein n=1 Tax=Mycolicibacterium xanthum TaxID=2796469 RepID=UPI001C843C8D|nr:hypothetical protein [Mycolicibacterium xanthum]MBX7434128.1 hypothetical protein [Mycolicibacterium xanthum]
MGDKAARRQKIGEWLRRYLPCEIAGTVGELGGAALAYAITGSLAAAAVAATIGASGGYYAAAYLNAVRWSHRALAHRPPLARLVLANLLALRSVAVEFGPAELIDSVIVRPIAFYAGPLLFGNVAAGWIFAKLVSDVGFYACAIVSYERFAGLLVQRRPRPANQEGESDEPTTTVPAV